MSTREEREQRIAEVRAEREANIAAAKGQTPPTTNTSKAGGTTASGNSNKPSANMTPSAIKAWERGQNSSSSGNSSSHWSNAQQVTALNPDSSAFAANAKDRYNEAQRGWYKAKEESYQNADNSAHAQKEKDSYVTDNILYHQWEQQQKGLKADSSAHAQAEKDDEAEKNPLFHQWKTAFDRQQEEKATRNQVKIDRLQKELDELDANSAYITTNDQYDEYQNKRKGIVDEMVSLGGDGKGSGERALSNAWDKTKDFFKGTDSRTTEGLNSVQIIEYNKLLSELDELNQEAAYSSTTAASDEYERRRKDILTQLHTLDAQAGREARTYDSRERTGAFFKSWGTGTGASYTNAAGNINEITTSAQGMERDIAELETQVARAQTAYDEAVQQYGEAGATFEKNLLVEAQQRLEAKKAQYAGMEKERAYDTKAQAVSQKLYDTADKLLTQSEQEMAKAKYGASGLGSFALDAAKTGLDVAADTALSYLGVPGLANMAVRVYGSEAQQARLQGDDAQTAAAKGLKSALIEVATEKIAGPFEKAYGKTALSSTINKAVDKLNASGLIKWAADTMGEGFEEGMSDVLNIMADHMMGFDSGENSVWGDIAADKDEIMYDMLLGAFVGAFGATGNAIGTRANTAPAAQVQPQVQQTAPVQTAPVQQDNAQPQTAQASSVVETQPTGDISAPPTAQSVKQGDSDTLNSPLSLNSRETQTEVPVEAQKNTAPTQETENTNINNKKTTDLPSVNAEASRLTSETAATESTENSIPTTEQNVNENAKDADVWKAEYKAALADAKPQAEMDYKAAVEKYYQQNPDADELPQFSLLANKVAWVDERARAIVKQKYREIGTNNYVEKVDDIDASSPNMETRYDENAESRTSRPTRDNGDFIDSEPSTEHLDELATRFLEENDPEGKWRLQNTYDVPFEERSYKYTDADVPQGNYGKRLPDAQHDSLYGQKSSSENEVRIEDVYAANGFAFEPVSAYDAINDAGSSAERLTQIRDIEHTGETSSAPDGNIDSVVDETAQSQISELEEMYLRDQQRLENEYLEQRYSDKHGFDNSKEWARLEKPAAESNGKAVNVLTDEQAWEMAEHAYGSDGHKAIVDATEKVSAGTFFFDEPQFLDSFNTSADKKIQSQNPKIKQISKETNEFKAMFKGVGDGRVGITEFLEYYSGLKDSSVLGDMYSYRVEEALKLAKKRFEIADKSITEYSIQKYQRSATKAIQMAAHYAEKANTIRTRLVDLSSSIESNNKPPKETGRNPLFKDELSSKMQKARDKFVSLQISPSNVFKRMDGFNKWNMGEGYALADMLEKAIAKNQSVSVEAMSFFSDVMQMDGYKDFSLGKTDSGVKLNGTSLAMDEAVSAYMAIRSALETKGYRVNTIRGIAVKNGGKNPTVLPVEDIGKLYIQLGEAIRNDKVANAYVNAFGKMAEYTGQQANEVSKVIDGVEAQMYDEGSYFPLSYYSDSFKNSDWDADIESPKSLGDIGYMKERERTGGGYIKVSPVAEVTSKYMSEMSDYIAFFELGDTLDIMNRMHTFGIDGLSGIMSEHMGDAYGTWMKNYIDDVNKRGARRAETKDKWLGKLTRNWQTAVLVGNIGTPMKQMGTLWNAAGELDIRAVAKAAIPFSGKEFKANKDSNPLLRYRAQGNIDASITDALSDQNTFFGKLASKSKALKWVENLIPAADVHEVGKVYIASCYDVLLKNPDMDITSAEFKMLADETFERACINTQAQYTMNARDEIARGGDNMMKALTMFQTQQRANANNLLCTIGEYKAAKGTSQSAAASKKLRQTVEGFGASCVAYGIMSALAQVAKHKLGEFRDDDEDEITIAEVAKYIGLNSLEAVTSTAAFGDSLTQAIISILSKGEEPYYDMSVGVIGAIDDFVNAAVDFSKYKSADSVRKFAGNAANLLGIPLNNAYSVVNSLAMYIANIIGIDSASTAANTFGIPSDLFKVSSKKADDILRIYDSINKAIAGFSPKELTFTDANGDDVTYTMSDKERTEYRQKAKETYTGISALLDTLGYSTADDAVVEAVDKDIISYAKNRASKNYLGDSADLLDTCAASWMNDVPEKTVGKFIFAKNTIKQMYENGKLTDYASMDDYLDNRLIGYMQLGNAGREALNNVSPRIDDMYTAHRAGISSKQWSITYEKYKELNNSTKQGYGTTDKTTDFSAWVDSRSSLTDDQKALLKDQFKFYSHIQGEASLYNKLTGAGYEPKEANDLYWRLDGMSTDGNSNVSQKEAYARLSSMDDISDEEKNVLWSVINTGWKTSYTQYKKKQS